MVIGMDMDKDRHTDHISAQFNAEMEGLKQQFLTMGGLVEKQLGDALSALLDEDSELAEQVVRKDTHINDLEMQIDEECRQIVARRQPAASDLRVVMTIGKAVVDLERIGDEAVKVARHGSTLAREGSAPRGYRECRHIGNHVRKMLYEALDSYARMDVEAAMRVLDEETQVDEEYDAAMRQLMTYMMEDSRSITQILNILWVIRALERVGDHSRNLAEFVIYMVKGKDLRHTPLEDVRREVGTG